MAKADKKMTILERNGEFVAEPPVHEMDGTAGNATFKLVNRTQEDILWVVTNTTLFQGGAFNEIINPKKLSGAKTIPNNPAAGVYEFTVLMMKSGVKVKGNSDPMIIIDT